MTTTPRRTSAAILLAAVTLGVAACGGTASSAGTDSTATSSPTRSATGTPLVVAEAGGTSGDAMQAGYIDPFTASTGIPVERVPTADLGKLQAAVKAGTHEVDVAELDSISAVAANALGLTETIDYAELKPVNPLTPAGQMPYGLGYQEFSTVDTTCWRCRRRQPSQQVAVPFRRQYLALQERPLPQLAAARAAPAQG